MGNHVARLRDRAYQHQQSTCFYCHCGMWLHDMQSFCIEHGLTKKQADQFKCTAEHLIARCEGGRDTASNIVAACRRCNQLRHARKKPMTVARFLGFVQSRISRLKWHNLSRDRLKRLRRSRDVQKS